MVSQPKVKQAEGLRHPEFPHVLGLKGIARYKGRTSRIGGAPPRHTRAEYWTMECDGRTIHTWELRNLYCAQIRRYTLQIVSPKQHHSLTSKNEQSLRRLLVRGLLLNKVGGDLLSRGCAVPSARLGLTSLFGMGRGDPQRYNHQNIGWTTFEPI